MLGVNLNDVGKPVWLALMVIGFVWFWPVGVMILAYLTWSGQLGTWRMPSLRRPQLWSTGNAAFDDHRADVLKKLDQEQRDFADFVERLRQAKDRSEFDTFMAEQQKRGQR